MSFFNKKQKQLALNCSRDRLEKAYHISEQNLHKASLSGDEKWLKKAMKQHGNFEYAMLYQNTPEFKKKKERGQNGNRKIDLYGKVLHRQE